MSSSGLCRCSSKAHEVSPGLVFVSKRKPQGFSDFPAWQERREVAWLICLHSPVFLWGRPACSPRLARKAATSLGGCELLPASFLALYSARNSWDGCQSRVGPNRPEWGTLTGSRFLSVIAVHGVGWGGWREGGRGS